MMGYFYLVMALVSGLYAVTYALWLRKNGNNAGAYAVYCLVALALFLPVYRLISGD